MIQKLNYGIEQMNQCPACRECENGKHEKCRAMELANIGILQYPWIHCRCLKENHFGLLN